MAENNAQNQPGTQNSMERTLRIEGERSASMFGLAVRVARIDQRLRELAVRQGPNPRKAYRLASTSYEQAIGMFEDALGKIERDIEIMPRRAPEGANRRDRQPKQVVKPQAKPTAAKPAVNPSADEGQNVAPAETQPVKPVLTKSQKKNQRKRMKKQQAAGAGTAQSKDQQQQQREEQHQEPAPASAQTAPIATPEASAAPAAGAVAEAATPEAGKAGAAKPRAVKPAAKPAEATAPAEPAPAEM